MSFSPEISENASKILEKPWRSVFFCLLLVVVDHAVFVFSLVRS